ncbi:MAG: hypothetical protein AAGG11_21105, partial [Pseudomonadota bacterium]
MDPNAFAPAAPNGAATDSPHSLPRLPFVRLARRSLATHNPGTGCGRIPIEKLLELSTGVIDGTLTEQQVGPMNR